MGGTLSACGRRSGWDGMTGLLGITRVELALFLNPVGLRDWVIVVWPDRVSTGLRPDPYPGSEYGYWSG
jgi:hypothetical protein